MTNAEFLTICVRATLGEPDASEGAWWQKYLSAAQKAKWDLPFAESEMNAPASRYNMARVLQEASPMHELSWGTYRPSAPIERKN